VHDSYVRVAVKIAAESEVLAVRRPGGVCVGGRATGESLQAGAVCVDDVDLGVSVAIGEEGDLARGAG